MQNCISNEYVINVRNCESKNTELKIYLLLTAALSN